MNQYECAFELHRSTVLNTLRVGKVCSSFVFSVRSAVGSKPYDFVRVMCTVYIETILDASKSKIVLET